MPSVLEAGLPLAEGVRVRVLARANAPPAVVLRALVLSGRVPGMVVVDLSPPFFHVPNEAWAESVALGENASQQIPPNATLHQRQTAWTTYKEKGLDHLFKPLLPRLGARTGPSKHLRALGDGLRHGLTAYRCASFGNVVNADMHDGSVRLILLNTTPGYRRFREAKVQDYLSQIRAGDARADAVLEYMVSAARRLVANGCPVLLVNMPMDRQLRQVDARINGDRWRTFAARLAAEPGVDFLDLGADETLAALPFYDGHHREYPVARQASAIMADLVAPHLPTALQRTQ